VARGSSATRAARTRSIARVVGKERAPAKDARTRRVKPVRQGPGAGERLRMLLSRRWFRALTLALLVGAAGSGLGMAARGGWVWLTHTPHFAIREIVVRHGPRVSASEVRQLANLSEGDNILAFRLRPTVEAIELHPWVKRASVMRELPDRVVIEVAEREPVGLVSLGALYYVDDEGEIFKKVQPGETVDYPVFTGITIQEAVEDKEGVAPLLALGLSILSQARESLILPLAEISEVRLDRSEGAIVVRASDGLRIILGRDDLPQRWQRAEQALVRLGDEAVKVSELDLNYEDRVTVRLREGTLPRPTPEAPERTMTNN
jgi:cell division protein FtsQ